MSATLDSGPIAALLGDAPVIASRGQGLSRGGTLSRGRARARFPRASPARSGRRSRRPRATSSCSFPASGEIRACAKELNETLDLAENGSRCMPSTATCRLRSRSAPSCPSRDRRKIVLATNIAETSLTIEGVHIVIDSGLTRMLRYDPATGMNRLVTVPYPGHRRNSARAGQAGSAPESATVSTVSMSSAGCRPFTQPEILVSDLAPLALELAVWGVKDPRDACVARCASCGCMGRPASGSLKALGARRSAGSRSPP